MGEGLKSSPQKTIREIFEETCPYLMAIGMTYDEFWNKDPFIAQMFLKSHKIRQKQENQRLWLQGYYNYIALMYVSPIFNPYAKRGTKPIPYPKEPIGLSSEELQERENEARQNRLFGLKQRLQMSVKKEE